MAGIRTEVYEACVAAAGAEPGMFRLPAPTGSGKTISAGGFALHHAARHELGRVIVAVPFLTITEQNASVYRSLLDGRDEPVVLEHHSQVDLDAGSRWHRLAAENWDAPFVVTTTVRLFEALFGRKPSAMRRIHRLAGAVIVLDEVQALPHRLLVPILDGLRTLVTEFGATVLLASATQPDFWRLSPFKDLPARNVIPEPSALAAGSHRVRFTWRTAPAQPLSETADDAAGREQAMVVVNTTAAAATVFDRWRDVVPDGVAWHLSTRMCPAHRRRVLETVRARLVADERVLLVSTQLIEAGVDIDFPVVYRALAPADSLLQAAGRANREGRMAQPGEVIIFDRGDRDQPPSYRMLVNVTRAHFGPGKADLHDLDAMRAYYGDVYGGLNLDEPNHVGQRIQQARSQFDFQSVTDGPPDAVTTKRDRRLAFRMIDDDTIAVVTPPGALHAEGRVLDLIGQLRTSPVPDRLALRHLQPYTTTIHRTALKKPGVLALLRPVLGEVGAPGSLAEWIGTYDDNTGIALDPRIEEFLL
jgi:CRISPR-associated endonuclease/helicase Cas3